MGCFKRGSCCGFLYLGYIWGVICVRYNNYFCFCLKGFVCVCVSDFFFFKEVCVVGFFFLYRNLKCFLFIFLILSFIFVLG